MTVNIDWTEFDDGETPEPETQPSGKGLRAQVEKMAARLKTVEAENVTLKREQARGLVSKAVEDLGYDPQVLSLYPADQSITPDAVTAWLGKNQALFAKLKTEPAATAESETTDEGEKPDESPVSEVPKSLEEMWSRLQDLEIAPPTGAQSIATKLQNAQTEEELMAIIDGGMDGSTSS